MTGTHEKANQKAVILTPPATPICGSVTLPGSKSITNRALLLAALSKGRSHLHGALHSDDTHHMQNALNAMGVQVTPEGTNGFSVIGQGGLNRPSAPLFLGNAGTAMRFLTAAAALVEGDVTLDGDEHMRKRPIAPLVRALGDLGVNATDTNGCPPVRVQGTGTFPHSRIVIDGSLSSQYVSAILMAAACGRQALEILIDRDGIGGRGYIDITLAVMESFGARIEPLGDNAWNVHPSGYTSCDYKVEPDASAATYLWAIEKLTSGTIDLGIDPKSMIQPDARAYDVISKFPHLPPVIDGSQMQDAVPTLAVLAMFNRTPVRFTGIENLRVKECDRIHAVASGLNRIKDGLATEDGDDLLIASDPNLSGQHLPAGIDTFADHRIAMSFALAGLRISGISILDPNCVSKTFPTYWDVLSKLGVSMKFI